MSSTPRFYMLSADNEHKDSKNIYRSPGIIISVGPVKLPEYLDRPQIVTKNKEGLLKFDEFHRWGESLEIAIAQQIRENLTVQLPGTTFILYPYNPIVAVKYQLIIEVIQLDSEIDKNMTLAVQWTLINVINSNTVFIKKSNFTQTILPHNYLGIAKTLSTLCNSLSTQIAESLKKTGTH